MAGEYLHGGGQLIARRVGAGIEQDQGEIAQLVVGQRVTVVAEGLTNKDVAGRLFVSPRTVQSHLAHVFAKLGVTTRTQLAQEEARHA
jgi:DNA-binding NarL/FixJ family response regulator